LGDLLEVKNLVLIPKEVRFWTFRKWRGRPACGRKSFDGRRDIRPTRHRPEVQLPRDFGIKSIIRSSLLHCTAVFFFCGFVLPLGAAPKKGAEEIMIVPPKAEPSFARVFLDVPQAIALHLSGRVNEPVEFFIRKKPRHGRLGEIRRTGPKSAVVDYTPNPGITPGSDSFTFAAKSMDSPVSAQARVDIQLLRRPAELEFKRQLDFGDAYLGDITTAHLIFRNRGGEAATVSLHAEGPWRIDGTSQVTIPGGGDVGVEVFFEPQSSGKFQGRFVVKSSVQDVDLPTISLTGFARESIAHPAQGLTITSAMRAALPASIPFTNHSDRERSLDFEWPASIDAPSSVSIPPGQTVDVPVDLRTDTTPSFALRETIAFCYGNQQSEFPLTLHPAPANITISPATILDLGEFALGETASAPLVVTNSGGLPAELRIEVPSALIVRPDPSVFIVPPGSQTSFEISSTLQKSGTFNFPLPIYSNNATIAEINVRAAARPAQPVEKVLGIPETPKPQPASVSAPLPIAAIPPVEECFLKESTSHSVTIYWKLTSPNTKDFIIERRVIKPGPDGRVVEQWELWKSIEIQISGDTATAHFRKLAPGTFWNIRLRGIDSKGLVGPPTPGHFRIETKALNLWQISFWLWMPALLALGAVLFLLSKKRIRFVRENLDQRIADLGQ
jgi:hypothetical protein